MSSFELLELFGVTIEEDDDGERTIKVDWAPENGAVDKAVREGGYTLLEQMAAETHNEVARLRLWYHVGHGGDKYEPFEFVDPRIERARAEHEAELAELQSAVEDDMFAGFNRKAV